MCWSWWAASFRTRMPRELKQLGVAAVFQPGASLEGSWNSFDERAG